MNKTIKSIKQSVIRSYAPFVVGLAAVLPLSTASATLLFYEGFDYNTGQLTGKNGGEGDWAAWSGPNNPQVVEPGSTTTLPNGSTITAPNPMAFSNGDVAHEGGNRLVAGGPTDGGTPLNRVFDTALTGQDIWFSMLFAGTQGGQVYVGLLGSGAAGWQNHGFRFDGEGVKASAGGNFSTAVGGNSISNVRLLVFNLVWDEAANNGNGGYGQTNLYVNPDTLTTPTSTTRSISGNLKPTSVTRFQIHGATPNQNIAWDEIRIGTTYESVVIPEPAHMTLLAGIGLGLGVLMLRRRPRNTV